MKALLFMLLMLFEVVFSQTSDEEFEQCMLPKYTGLCRASLQRYFFNAATGKCEKFIYGGCGTLGNSMGTIEECERICGRGIELFNTAKSLHGLNLVCLMNKTNGVPCTGRTLPEDKTVWYYDVFSLSCKSFRFIGCGGNQNKFPTEAKCQEMCTKTNTGATKREEAEERRYAAEVAEEEQASRKKGEVGDREEHKMAEVDQKRRDGVARQDYKKTEERPETEEDGGRLKQIRETADLR